MAGNYFMSHPEVESIMDEYHSRLMQESDRGLIIFGCSILEKQLIAFFKAIAPENMGETKKIKIFGRPFPFNDMCSNLDIAYVCRLMPKELIQTINILRNLRNRLAHNPSSFLLSNYENEIRQIFSAANIDNVATELSQALADVKLEAIIMKEVEQMEGDFQKAKLREQMEQLIAEEGELSKTINLTNLKSKFTFAIFIVCGLIIMHRENACELFGDNDSVTNIIERSKN